MDLVDWINVRRLKYQLLNKKLNIKLLKSIDSDTLLYNVDEDYSLLDMLFEYKRKYGLQLSLINADWNNEKIQNILLKNIDCITEEDLLLKSNNNYIFDIIYNNDIGELAYLLGNLKTHSIEFIDLLVKHNNPEEILSFGEELMADVKNNLDAILEKYKDKYIVFEKVLERLSNFNDKQEIIDICKKYNREFLLNNIFSHSTVSAFVMDSQQIEEKKDALPDDLKILLETFSVLYTNDKNKHDIHVVYDSFYQSLLAGNEMAIYILEKAIEIKKYYPFFEITFDGNTDSLFNHAGETPRKININHNEELPVVVFHEFAHAIHCLNDNSNTQYGISNTIEIIRSNPHEFMERYKKFKESYNIERGKIEEGVKKEVERIIEERLNKQSENRAKLLDRLNLEDEYKKQLEGLSNYEQLFYDYRKQMMLKEKINKYFLKYSPSVAQLSDIFDSITMGRVRDIDKLHGHGINYNHSTHRSVKEIIACFTAIRCLPDYQKNMHYMKEYLGEELFNVIKAGCDEALGFEEQNREIKM